MYLHLGKEVVVKQREVIGVFDIENTTVSHTTRRFLQQAEKQQAVTYVNFDLPKSFTVCAPPRNKPGKTAVIVSPIAPRTLKKRADFLKNTSHKEDFNHE